MSKPELDEWNQCWVEGTIPWHVNRIHPFVKKHFKTWMNGETVGKRMLVPLCGATLDMFWFYEQGLNVVGIEVSESAIIQFFANCKLTYTVEKLSESCSVYSHDDRLKVFSCDLFSVNVELLGGAFDYWLDRGSLCAMLVENQQKYIDLILSLLSANGRGFMECFEYQPPSRPVPIFFDDLTKLLGGRYKPVELERVKPEELPKELQLGIQSLFVYYLLEAGV